MTITRKFIPLTEPIYRGNNVAHNFLFINLTLYSKPTKFINKMLWNQFMKIKRNQIPHF